MAKQIIDLPGTRVDTLYTTTRSGTNENGDDYEERQATAPRTFEKAITDDNGIILSEKIADILERIGQLSGGEYDVLLQEIEDIKQEIAGLDLTQWNYLVPFGKDIIFVAQDGTGAKRGVFGKDAENNIRLMNNNTTFVILGENDVEMVKKLYAPHLFLPGTSQIIIGGTKAEPYKSSVGITRAANGDVTFQQWNSGGNWYKYFILSNVVHMQTRMVFDEHTPIQMGNNVIVKRAFWGAIDVNAKITVPKGINTGTNINGGIQFNDEESADTIVQVIYEELESAQLKFMYGTKNAGYKMSAYIGIDGVWHFTNAIAAPNMASMAAIVSAEQNITEQDLQMIDTQRNITEQDIANIETQQTITDMELMIIGGQVA